MGYVVNLCEVVCSSLEHVDLVVSGYVLVQTLVVTLGVTHLTEDPSVGRGDTLDGECRVVRVEGYIGCRITVKVYILRSYLAVFSEPAYLSLVAEETPLSV